MSEMLPLTLKAGDLGYRPFFSGPWFPACYCMFCVADQVALP
jgi:hypothetical protein